MKYYAVYRNGKKYCVVESRDIAKNIVKAMIEKENSIQNKKNCFVNLSVTIKEITLPV